MAVVKANAYGHGLKWVARSLADAVDGFGVSCAEEGIVLREAGIEHPICLFEDSSARTNSHCSRAIAWSRRSITSTSSTCSSTPPGEPGPVWVKVDTGMHRLGFPPEDVPEILVRLKTCPAVSEVRLMSHLANADNKFDGTTQDQIDRFHRLVEGSASRRASPIPPVSWHGRRAISTGYGRASCSTACRPSWAFVPTSSISSRS